MIETTDDRKAATRKRRDRHRRVVGFTLFGCAAAILLFIVWDGKRYQWQLDDAIEDQTDALVQLKLEESKRQKAAEQAEKDKYLVFQFLNECRVADDIPELVGSMIYSQHRGYRGFACWVPEGSHRLQITAKVSTRAKEPSDERAEEDAGSSKPQSSSGAEPKSNDAAKPIPPEVKTLEWNVPLEGASGYLFELNSQKKETPLSWNLTSNAEGFDAQTEPITEQAFDPSSWSYSDSDSLFYPTPSKRAARIQGADTGEQQLEGVQVFNLSLASSLGETKIRVDLRATIVTTP